MSGVAESDDVVTHQLDPVTHVERHAVTVTTTYTFSNGATDDINEYLTATWEPEIKTDHGFTHGGYWTVCGDNTGSQSLVVWPHHVQPLIDLLEQIKAREVAKGSAPK